MLYRTFFKEYIKNDLILADPKYSKSIYEYLAEQVSWWFSRLLRLQDNDLKEYKGFNYIEILYLCDKLTGMTMWDYTDEDLQKFKELLERVKKYVRLKFYEYEEGEKK